LSNAVEPVLAGCHPDPSVCRVGSEYFLVTSTFTYHPGIPVHRSTDLKAWELIGHVLTADDRGLVGLDSSDGVWAPTIRHHGGVFYVIWAEAERRKSSRTLVSTAVDPSGPWTVPVELDADGIDPSLFFDDDGRCWFTAARDTEQPQATGPAEIWMREFDFRVLELVGPSHVLWHGAMHGQWVEAPHIYKHAGRYHLIAAEGGTERNHAVTAAQADAVTGPYRTDPRSPLLTHRHLGPDAAVQSVGHVDIVDTPSGGAAGLVLGIRPLGGFHSLGREVFLVSASWEPEGLVLAPGLGHLEPHPAGALTSSPEWLSLRGPVAWTRTAGGIALGARPDAIS
jgi:xylan 1,4-beta-xylosidase